ncbi:MAG: uracil-DNA glycosylase [Caldilineaceae bacterium]
MTKPVDESHVERAQRLTALNAEVAVCQRCPLAMTRTHAVPGEGNADAVVMFVGEGPGFEEDRQGRPFVGRSGQYLTETLSKVGIRRKDVYITNVVKCRPPDNRDPQPAELAACDDYLARQVEIINPRIVVTLGRFSMRRWFKEGGITKIHGKITNIGRGRVAIAMFHPAAALRNPQWRVEFEAHAVVAGVLIARAERQCRRRTGRSCRRVPHPGDADYVPPPVDVMPTTTPNSASCHSATRQVRPSSMSQNSLRPVDTTGVAAPARRSRRLWPHCLCAQAVPLTAHHNDTRFGIHAGSCEVIDKTNKFDSQQRSGIA